MAIIKDGATIEGGLEASKMRRKMESKDTLATKGALYVGTGIPDKDAFTITKSIAPEADDNGKVLVADSESAVGWAIKECPKATEATTATTVSTTIGKAKITDIFEDDGTTVKTAAMAKGLQSNTAESTGVGNTWYEFDGNSNNLGSLVRPTIIRTSEARPKAKIKSGESTATKEIALLEDIPRVGEWVTITVGTNSATDSKVTEAGTYEVTVLDVANLAMFLGTTLVHWDGVDNIGQSCYSVANYDSSGSRGVFAVYTTQVVIRMDGTLAVQGHIYTQTDSSVGAKWNYSSYGINKFKFRKVF